jgi:hypothetical protein
MSKFRQQDVTRALKGAIAAGVEIARVEIDPTGKIVIQLSSGEVKEQAAPDDLDRELAEFEAHHGKG